jgi:hypothetical protein
MKCDDVRARLDDHEDGLLSEAELQELELHLATCDACRVEARRLHDLVGAAAAAPREMDPPRDLWPEIAARVAADRGRAPVRRLVRLLSHPASLAAAAAVIVALGSTVTWRTNEPPADTGVAHNVSERGSQEHVQAAEVDYIRATGQLMDALNSRRSSLSPETQKAVDENLKVIDDALGQLRGALDKDPGNRQLTRMLASTHQKKLDLLLRLLKLSSQI